MTIRTAYRRLAKRLEAMACTFRNWGLGLRCALMICLLVLAPASFALPPEVESNIDKLFTPWNQPNTPGCAVGIFKRGEIVYAKGFGIANLENNAPIAPDTKFDIASISKQFTAAAIVVLNQRGKVSLDDDVRKFIPELPSYGRTITIRHLIHHTSGLRDYDTLLSLHGRMKPSWIIGTRSKRSVVKSISTLIQVTSIPTVILAIS